MNNFIKSIAVGLLAAGSANAGTTVNLKGNPNILPPCGTPWVTNVVATSIDNNGTVHGQVEYVGVQVAGSGRYTTYHYNYTIMNAVWDVNGTLVSETPSSSTGCPSTTLAVNFLVGNFAVPNNLPSSTVHSYTNTIDTVTSQYGIGAYGRQQWNTILTH